MYRQDLNIRLQDLKTFRLIQVARMNTVVVFLKRLFNLDNVFHNLVTQMSSIMHALVVYLIILWLAFRLPYPTLSRNLRQKLKKLNLHHSLYVCMKNVCIFWR